MLLILAATADVTARRVSRWLRHAGADVLQIDCDDPIVDVSITIDDDREEARLRSRSGRAFRLSEVDAFWYRRGELAPDPTLIGTGEAARARLQEWAALHDWLLSRLEAKPSLGSWERETRCTKLEQLGAARALGLAIPGTQISSDRADLLQAIQRWPRAVSKAIQSGAPAEEHDTRARSSTVAATTTPLRSNTLLQRAPPRFFPRLAQERLEKTIELRIFFVARQMWTLAMIPRSGAALPVDVRTAELDQSFHLVPYDLPPTLRAKLVRLMTALNLDTGSIDMIVGPDGQHTFLEVNPSGQLDWLARALNAPIERAIAEHLLALAGADRGTKELSSAGSTSAAERHVRPLGVEAVAEDRGAAAAAAQPRFRADVPPPDTDRTLTNAPQRFTRARGQRVLVHAPHTPILRRLVAPVSTASAADTREHHANAGSSPQLPGETTPDPNPPCGSPGHQALAPPQGRRGGDDDDRQRAPTPPAARLPASVQVVEGTQGSLLYDLQRGKAYAIPPGLAPSLSAGTCPIPRDQAERRWLSAAGDLLRLELPPQLAARLAQRSLAWEHPSAITNAVIDVDEGSEHNFAAIFAALHEVGCEHALLRIQRPDGLALIDRLMPLLDDRPPLFLELWLAADASIDAAQLAPRVARWSRITSVVLFGATEAREWLSPRSGVGTILSRTEELDLGPPPSPSLAEMLVRDELFRESIEHHPAFHRKLAIGADGELRNAPGLSHSFGRFGERPLQEVVAEPEFQRLGGIHRGRLAGCSECEFRRACTDSREPYLGADGRYHHTTVCALDPRHRAPSTAKPPESAR